MRRRKLGRGKEKASAGNIRRSAGRGGSSSSIRGGEREKGKFSQQKELTGIFP